MDFQASRRAWVISQICPTIKAYRNIVRTITELSKPDKVVFYQHNFKIPLPDDEICGIRCDIHPSLNFMSVAVEYANDYRYIENGANVGLFTTGPFKQSWKCMQWVKIGFITRPKFHPTQPLMAFAAGTGYIQICMQTGLTTYVHDTDDWIRSPTGWDTIRSQECYQIAMSVRAIASNLGCVVRCAVIETDTSNSIRVIIHKTK